MRRRRTNPADTDRLTADVFHLMGAVRERLDGLGALGPQAKTTAKNARPAASPAPIPRADRAAEPEDGDVTVAKGWGERPPRRRG